MTRKNLPGRIIAAVHGCAWCGNTGTVNGDYCPICRPNGGGQ